jgi:hypothetical protein
VRPSVAPKLGHFPGSLQKRRRGELPCSTDDLPLPEADCTGCEHKFGIASPFSLYSINGGAPTTPPS